MLLSAPAEARGRGGRKTGTRTPGNFQSQYQGTRTGPNGQSSQVNRATNLNRTGRNSWQRETQQTVTGPGGRQRSWEAQGNGNVNKAENGYQKTYNGTLTNGRGQTNDVNRTINLTRDTNSSITRDKSSTYTNETTGKSWEVDKSATTTRDGEGGFTTSRDSSVTAPEGRTLGTGHSTTAGQKGQGIRTTGSWTNQAGQSWQYEGQSHHPQAGEADHTQTVTTPTGRQRTTTGTAKWQHQTTTP